MTLLNFERTGFHSPAICWASAICWGVIILAIVLHRVKERWQVKQFDKQRQPSAATGDVFSGVGATRPHIRLMDLRTGPLKSVSAFGFFGYQQEKRLMNE